MSDTKEFIKDHVGMEVNLSDKHKRIFETVNELNEWSQSLDDASDKEMGCMGKRPAQDILKGEEKKRLVLWIGDTGESTHVTHIRKGFICTRRANVKAQFGRNGDTENVDVMGSWKGRSHRLGKDL